MKTHKPIPYRNEDFEDSIGNKAIITKIDFTYQKYKKSKKQTCIGHVLYVKWYYINEYWKNNMLCPVCDEDLKNKKIKVERNSYEKSI